jgi:hypothetical protein
MFLNCDGRDVVLSVSPQDGRGSYLHLRERYATPVLAARMADVLAKRLGLRRRGSGWMRVVR